jgi:superoxide dismutase, Cu-Zn family
MSILLGPAPVRAEAILVDHRGKTVGRVTFQENLNFWQTRIEIDVWDQKPGLHGIHIHSLGDVNPAYTYSEVNVSRIPCDALGGHFDPHMTGVHGSNLSDLTARHVGDMGNIAVNSSGWGTRVFWDRLIQLRGLHSVIGLPVVLHSCADDLGRGTNSESRKTGNSGERIACGIIRRIRTC